MSFKADFNQRETLFFLLLSFFFFLSFSFFSRAIREEASMAAFVIARCYAMHERGEHTVHNRRPSFFVLSFVRSFSWPATFLPTLSATTIATRDLNLFHFVSLTTRSHRSPLPSSPLPFASCSTVARGGERGEQMPDRYRG